MVNARSTSVQGLNLLVIIFITIIWKQYEYYGTKYCELKTKLVEMLYLQYLE